MIVPPTLLKAFVCGKGNAPKEQVILSVYKRWGYEASDNNDADARALLELGLVFARWQAGEETTKAHVGLCAKLSVIEPKPS